MSLKEALQLFARCVGKDVTMTPITGEPDDYQNMKSVTSLGSDVYEFGFNDGYSFYSNNVAKINVHDVVHTQVYP